MYYTTHAEWETMRTEFHEHIKDKTNKNVKQWDSRLTHCPSTATTAYVQRSRTEIILWWLVNEIVGQDHEGAEWLDNYRINVDQLTQTTDCWSRLE